MIQLIKRGSSSGLFFILFFLVLLSSFSFAGLTWTRPIGNVTIINVSNVLNVTNNITNNIYNGSIVNITNNITNNIYNGSITNITNNFIIPNDTYVPYVGMNQTLNVYSNLIQENSSSSRWYFENEVFVVQAIK
jgi:hypothetical protein